MFIRKHKLKQLRKKVERSDIKDVINRYHNNGIEEKIYVFIDTLQEEIPELVEYVDLDLFYKSLIDVDTIGHMGKQYDELKESMKKISGLGSKIKIKKISERFPSFEETVDTLKKVSEKIEKVVKREWEISSNLYDEIIKLSQEKKLVFEYITDNKEYRELIFRRAFPERKDAEKYLRGKTDLLKYKNKTEYLTFKLGVEILNPIMDKNLKKMLLNSAEEKSKKPSKVLKLREAFDKYMLDDIYGPESS